MKFLFACGDDMNIRKIGSLLCLPAFLALFSQCGGKTNKAPEVHADIGDTADGRFEQVLSFLSLEMEQHHVPGASVAIIENGKIAYAAGLGVREDGQPEPVLATTLFKVASLSKVVLAATAMTLIEDKIYVLDRPVGDIVDLNLAAPFQGAPITLRDLLTHTSGLPDMEPTTLSCDTGRGQIAAWFASQPAQPLWTPPGEVWNYSNRGFSAAGMVIEYVADLPYEEIVRQRVFTKAGMDTATYDPVVARAADHAVGHVRKNGAFTKSDVDAYDCAASRPPAGVIASAIDYGHLAETLLAGGGTMLSPDSIATMEQGMADTDQRPGGARRYGFGLEVEDDYKGMRVIHHNGEAATGYRTAMWMVPERNFGVVVFYNALGANPDTAAREAMDVFLDVANVSAPSAKTPPSTWTQYTGNYFDPYAYGAVNVTLDGDALTLNAPGYGISNVPLTQTSGDEFSATVDGKTVPIVFYPGKTGPAGWLVSRNGVGKRQQ
jgi:CubicO group peptidase (beta-lactamase class C family)